MKRVVREVRTCVTERSIVRSLENRDL